MCLPILVVMSLVIMLMDSAGLASVKSGGSNYTCKNPLSVCAMTGKLPLTAAWVTD
jgi:hypothetical protein